MRTTRKFPLKRSILKQLFDTEPIIVRHDTPQSLTPDGQPCYGAKEVDFKCFDDFWYFADWINKLYDGLLEPIRLQELGDTSITGSLAEDGPAYGRRYEIYYNQCKIGRLEICSEIVLSFKEGDGSVNVEVSLNNIPPRVLPFSAVYGFLQIVASLVTSTNKESLYSAGMTEYEFALSKIEHSMLEIVWEISDDPNYLVPGLILFFSGLPDHYYELLEHKIKNEKN